MRKSVRERFAEMIRLYHFTSFDAARKIIKSGKLLFGKPFRMNDLIESDRMTFRRAIEGFISEDDSKNLLAEAELHRYQQISFSQDRVCEDCTYLGFDLHSMWGLYADKGYGVCLVFDKDKLALQEGDYANNVAYTSLVPQGQILHNKSRTGIKAEIWRRKDDIYFIKRKEWEHEQEYRVICRAKHEWDDEYLDISDALSFVIICKDYSVCYGNRKLPVLVYEYGLDWYTLWERWMDPIWTEQCGFM